MDKNIEILSSIAIFNKYAKYIPEKERRETWEEIVERNKQMHLSKFPELKNDLDKVYQLVLEKKVLPSMRSLQFAGKPVEVNPVRIYNCSYLPIDDTKAFAETMFLLLCGSGVGYSVQKHHIEKLPEIKKPRKGRRKRFVIGDSIEGWADAINALIKSYYKGTAPLLFDYSDIREKGMPLITSGGKAPGPAPLKECIENIKSILDDTNDGEKLSSVQIHDILCHIADAVLSGGIRRAAMIALFSDDDEEMLTCKSGNWWESNPQRGRANNSVVLLRKETAKDHFDSLWLKVEESRAGEPGFYFTNDKDWGTNPCVEIALRPFQFCNLTEINASNIESQEDYNNRAWAAAVLGTLQASYTDFHYLRDVWRETTELDALIGVSMTGIASNEVFKYNMEEAAEIVKQTNKEYAERIGINPAARTTCVKPAGTTSLVLGTSSGVHGWYDEFYLRRMGMSKNESLYTYLLINLPELLEDDLNDPNQRAFIVVPQKAPESGSLRLESPIETLERVKKVTLDWVKPGHIDGVNTHNVSTTINLKDGEWEEVGEWMWENRFLYNGISVFPFDGGTYRQTPFETTTEDVYERMSTHLKAIDLSKVVETSDKTDVQNELACQGGSCEII